MKIGRMGLSRRLRTALGSLVADYRTLVQYGYCARASGGRLSDIRADGVLRYGLWWPIIGHSCRLHSALRSEDRRNEALVQ